MLTATIINFFVLLAIKINNYTG